MSKVRKNVLSIAFAIYAVYFICTFFLHIIVFLATVSDVFNYLLFKLVDNIEISDAFLRELDRAYDAAFEKIFFIPFQLSLVYFSATILSDIIEGKNYIRWAILYCISLTIMYLICRCASEASWHIIYVRSLSGWIYENL